MFEKNHYVPILKWKKGEQNACEGLTPDIKNGFTPLIEIPPIDWDYDNDQPKKTIDEHLNGIGETFRRALGDGKTFFLDLLWIEPFERMQNGDHPLSYILQDARSKGVNVVPVTGCGKDEDYQREVKDAHYQDGLGLCFRLTEENFEDFQINIDQLLSTYEVSPSEVDLLIDYSYTNRKDRTRTYLFLTGLLNNIPHCLEWRNIILSGTSIPRDLSKIDRNSIENIERAEWIIWNRIVSNAAKFERVPLFGDYVVANPEPFTADPRFIKMSANIKYTSNDRFIIFKGSQLRKYGFDQYHDLANQVVQHQEYRGFSYSAGDNYIYEVSHNNNGPGNPTKWLEAGTSHHLTFVVNDLANLFYSSVSS